MTHTEPTLHLAESFAFRTLGSDTIAVELHELTLGATAVTATFRLSWDQWERTITSGYFHLDETDPPPTLEADRSVELTGRLRSALADDLSADPDTIRTRVSDPDDPLRSTAAWYATEIGQQLDLDDSPVDTVDSASIGAETEWAARRASGRVAPSILETITSYLDGEDWEYRVDDQRPVVRFEAALDDQRTWSMTAHVDADTRSCTLVSVHPDPVPPATLSDAALGLMISNYDLDHGSFEFDPIDGIVSFRTRILPDAEPFARAIQAHIGQMADHYDVIASFAAGESPQRQSTDNNSEDDGGWYSTDTYRT